MEKLFLTFLLLTIFSSSAFAKSKWFDEEQNPLIPEKSSYPWSVNLFSTITFDLITNFFSAKGKIFTDSNTANNLNWNKKHSFYGWNFWIVDAYSGDYLHCNTCFGHDDASASGWFKAGVFDFRTCESPIYYTKSLTKNVTHHRYYGDNNYNQYDLKMLTNLHK